MTNAEGTRVTRTYTRHIHGPIDEVFSLLCPTREHEWIEAWTQSGSGRLFYSDSGYNEKYCVFESKIVPLWGPEIWVTSQHDPENHTIQFVRVQPETMVVVSDVALEALPDGTTQYRLRDTMTALTPAGAAILSAMSQEAFEMHMSVLGETLDHFCSTGEMLTAS